MDSVFLNSLVYNLLFLPVFITAVFLARYITGKVVLNNIIEKRSVIEKNYSFTYCRYDSLGLSGNRF